jgi:hypothetical protein
MLPGDNVTMMMRLLQGHTRGRGGSYDAIFWQFTKS